MSRRSGGVHGSQNGGNQVYRLWMYVSTPWRYGRALRRIKREYGTVCANFELCHHASCMASYSAWATADETLEGNE